MLVTELGDGTACGPLGKEGAVSSLVCLCSANRKEEDLQLLWNWDGCYYFQHLPYNRSSGTWRVFRREDEVLERDWRHENRCGDIMSATGCGEE